MAPVLSATVGSPGLLCSSPSAFTSTMISPTLVNAINPQFFTHNPG